MWRWLGIYYCSMHVVHESCLSSFICATCQHGHVVMNKTICNSGTSVATSSCPAILHGYHHAKVHRKRIKTEEKAKVLASVWGIEYIIYSIPCRSLAVMHRTIWTIGWIAPGWFERKDEFILFFKIVLGKIANAARNWILKIEIENCCRIGADLAHQRSHNGPSTRFFFIVTRSSLFCRRCC